MEQVIRGARGGGKGNGSTLGKRGVIPGWEERREERLELGERETVSEVQDVGTSVSVPAASMLVAGADSEPSERGMVGRSVGLEEKLGIPRLAAGASPIISNRNQSIMVPANNLFGRLESCPLTCNDAMSSVPLPLIWDPATSPFASVLGTNYVPSLAELAQLKTALVGPQQELYRLESEITRVQAALDCLLSEKKRVEAYIDAHQALMSPIRQIPFETLAEIFSWCLPSETAYGVRSLKHAPLLMTMVCRDWRRVAKETPQLWSSLHIYLPPRFSQNAASQRIAGLTSWLQHSAKLPVSISLHGGFYTPGINYPEAPGNMALMVKSLVAFRDRIKHMNLALKRADLMIFLELLPSNSPFPYLTSVILEDIAHGRGHAWSMVVDELEGAPYYGTLLSQDRMPMLQSLEIKIPRDRNLFSALPCRWGGITNLSIKDFLAPADLLGILAGSGALKALEVGLIVPEQDYLFDEPAVLPTAILADLVRLHLQICINGYRPSDMDEEHWQSQCVAQISTITSHMIFPSLRNLHVSLKGTITTFFQVPLHNFPLHGIETLGLDIPMTPEAFTEFLSLVPNVTSLDFVDAGDSIDWQHKSTLADRHFLGLTPSPSNPLSCCPLLRRFRMIDRTSDYSMNWTRQWSTRALTEFITARRKARMLDFCDMFIATLPLFPDEEVLRLRQAKEDGLELHLHQTKKLDAFAFEDGPMAGIIEKYNFSPATLSDMDGSFDTDVII
ncbi:hypothetical protein GYMLUDRAFT_84663 [Collybiopsis luxurians FD-317 M1]|uniref:F-box domain-containing protein n=1 Tax=Collybiopsis luxurians FD-317 M1 TaxID=944289 RepID=A0A0D0CZM0_9AGAR|nr:hypothetical protein GYMLUDRAFT_84663 [Collybiopsis luxurians FD-317 M1]